MGKYHVKFRCGHCGHCCRDVICLPTPWDVIQITKATGESPHDFLEFLTPDNISGIRRSDPTWLKIDGRQYLMAIRQSRRSCHFLDTGAVRCRVYEHRPLICRLYPFAVHETRDGRYRRFDLHRDVGCPRNRDGRVPTKPLLDLYRQDSEHREDYEDLVAFFNRNTSGGKRPADFIRLFYVRM